MDQAAVDPDLAVAQDQVITHLLQILQHPLKVIMAVAILVHCQAYNKVAAEAVGPVTLVEMVGQVMVVTVVMELNSQLV